MEGDCPEVFMKSDWSRHFGRRAYDRCSAFEGHGVADRLEIAHEDHPLDVRRV